MPRFRLTPSDAIMRGGLLMLLVILAFCFLDASLIFSRPMPDGDLAADMLLGNDLIHQGYLFHGHYSRWDFNHLGPFWFYWNHVFEVVLSPFDGSRFQVWQAGSIATSAALLSLGAASLSIYLTGVLRLRSALLIVILTLGLCGHEVSGLWMPWRIVSPYFCFLVMLLWLSEGRSRALPVAAFLCGVLIHGYITMPLFTLPLLLAAVWWGQKATGFLRSKEGKMALILAGLLLLLFALPVLLDAAGFDQSPTNFSKILSAQKVMKMSPKPGIHDLLGFYGGILRFHEAQLTWALFLGLSAFLLFSGQLHLLNQPRVKRIFALCLTVTVLVFGYCARTPLPIFPFIAIFYVVAPILFMASIGVISLEASLFRRQQTASAIRRYGVASLFLGLPLGLITLSLDRPGPPYPAKTIQEWTQVIDRDHGAQDLRLHHAKDSDWPLVAGMLLEWEKRGLRACVTRPDFAVVYTASHICSLSQNPTYEVVEASACGSECVAVSEGRGLRPFQLKPIAANVPLLMESGDHVLLIGWSELSGGARWSLGKRVGLVFHAEDPSAFEGRLEIKGTSLGPQTLRMEWNGQEILNQRMVLGAGGLNLPLPQNGVRAGNNILRIDLPEARMPGNGDLRILGLRLRDIRVR